MKRSQILAAIPGVCLALICGTASASFVDGHKLKEWSDADNRIENGGRASSDIHAETLFIGYVSGVSDVLGGLAFCSTPNARLGQMIGVVKKHVLASPEKWNEPAAVLVVEALKQAFPCK